MLRSYVKASPSGAQAHRIPTVYAIAPIVRTVRYCIFIDTLEMSLTLYCR